MKEKTCDCGEPLVDGRCPPCDKRDAARKPGLAPGAKKRRAELIDQRRRETVTYADRKRVGERVASFDPIYAVGHAYGQRGADYRFGRGRAKKKAARS